MPRRKKTEEETKSKQPVKKTVVKKAAPKKTAAKKTTAKKKDPEKKSVKKTVKKTSSTLKKTKTVSTSAKKKAQPKEDNNLIKPKKLSKSGVAESLEGDLTYSKLRVDQHDSFKFAAKLDEMRSEKMIGKHLETHEQKINVRSNQDKRFMMWSLVSFFMVLIIFLWFMNLDNILRHDVKNDIQNKHLSDAKAELEKTFAEVKDSYKKTQEVINKETERLKEEYSDIPTEQKIKEVDLLRKIAVGAISQTIGSTTASSTNESEIVDSGKMASSTELEPSPYYKNMSTSSPSVDLDELRKYLKKLEMELNQ
jgi:hypothetical protein